MRRLSVALSTLLLAFTLAGCGLGNATTMTQSMGGVGNGSDTEIGSMKVEDITVVVGADGIGITATAINQSLTPDQLLSVKIDGVQSVLANNGIAAAAIDIKGHAAVRIGFIDGFSATQGSNPTVIAGQYTPVYFHFAEAGGVTVNALVVAKSDYYSDVITTPVA